MPETTNHSDLPELFGFASQLDRDRFGGWTIEEIRERIAEEVFRLLIACPMTCEDELLPSPDSLFQRAVLEASERYGSELCCRSRICYHAAARSYLEALGSIGIEVQDDG
jgi:hypothetical protein